MKYTALIILAAFSLVSCTSIRQEPARVVFISGKPKKKPGDHEHRAGNMLLAKALNESGLVNATVLDDVGYPKDPTVLESADSIVVFCSGYNKHTLKGHYEAFDALMKKGVGLVLIHWATEAENKHGDLFKSWIGGFCDVKLSVNPHWTPSFDDFPDHPVANGVKPFSVNDEWYYHMNFLHGMKGVTSILADLPGPETLTRPDGPRHGNPDVRRSVAAGEAQTVAWAYQRPDGGRGFGFTGAHIHKNWKNDDYRKVVLNAIVWTAHRTVPKNGVPSTTPTDKEIAANWDNK